MPRPINYPISPDAPDSENPDLSVKLKVGPPRMKAPKPKGITKPDPQDAGVFTQEKLKRFGGTMRDIPQGMDGAMKKGGSVKRFSAGGGDDFGAMNEGPAGDDSYTPAPKSRGMEPAAKPKMNMGTAEGFKKSGLTRTEYLNKLNGLSARRKPKEDESWKKTAKAAQDEDESWKKTARTAQDAATKETFLEPIRRNKAENTDTSDMSMKKGGKVSKFASGGFVRAADGCAQRGKTRGTMR